MKPRDIFGVAVRIVGLIAILVGIYFLIDGGILALTTSFGASFAVWLFVVLAVVFILAGLYLLGGAPHIIRFAYPKDDQESDKPRDA